MTTDDINHNKSDHLMPVVSDASNKIGECPRYKLIIERKNWFLLNLLPILGLIFVLGIVLLCLPANTGSLEPGPSGDVNIQAMPEAKSQAPPPQGAITTTHWISLDGSQPTTFAEWQAQQPPPPPLHLERVYASRVPSARIISGETACVLVNLTIYDGISTSLAQWISDVESEGWNVVIYASSFPDPPALRDHLASIADLDGCLLIGDFPVPWYELGNKQFPMDVYYMDLNGVWSDSDLDGLYDDHTGEVEPELWIGRLLASNLDFGDDETTLLNNYFAKNHAYRSGNLPLPARALVYIDDDWASGADSMSQTMRLLYPDTTIISDPNTTRAADYAQRLIDYYAWIHVFAHSSAQSHTFTYHEGEDEYQDAIRNEDIYSIDPHTFFYNLFACGAARFVERNYLAGWYVFADSYGLAALGCTTSGSMVRGYDPFYESLAQGNPLGQAYREWFRVYGIADKGWHYGLTLHGDPTLSVTTAEQIGEAPVRVTITGPTTGVVQSTCVFTAAVSPVTATQPLQYAWRATGQTPVTRKSGESDAVAFTWRNSPGTKIITVTATNFEGAVTNTHVLTVEAPEIEVTPSFFHETLALGTTLTRTLTISNTGRGRLTFDLAEADHGALAGSEPDLFGYTYKDSNAAGGPTYEWIEIAPPAGGSGAKADLPTVWQGGYSWPISLPFAFNYYGIDYTELAINSHGTLNFKDRYIGRGNLSIPSARIFGVETFIAHFWDFLVVSPGAVYYQALDAMFIVEYYQVSRYGGSDHGTWEAILFENGNILFQYKDVDFSYYWGNDGRSATVGIQGDAITGLQYSYDTPALSDGLAICFAYPGQLPDCSAYEDVPWLAESPDAGAVAAGDTRSIEVAFDAIAPQVTQPGEYQSALVVVTNDPDENLVTLPVTMTVISPTFGLTLAPLTGAGSGNPGTTVTYTLRLTNTGNTFDTFDVIASGYSWPTNAPSTVGPLAAGECASMEVTVEIPASATGGATDVAAIMVTSQGDEGISATATLTTKANVVNGVVVTPVMDAQSGHPGVEVTYTLQVTNTGNITDTFDVSVSSHNWPTNAPTTIGPLAADDKVDVEVTVDIPASAAGGATDTATISVTSQTENTVSATIKLTTQAKLHILFLPLIMK